MAIGEAGIQILCDWERVTQMIQMEGILPVMICRNSRPPEDFLEYA